MKKVHISLIGCDDVTVFDIECTNDQYEFLKTICRMSDEKSECSCMPVMEADAFETLGKRASIYNNGCMDRYSYCCSNCGKVYSYFDRPKYCRECNALFVDYGER